MQKHQRKYEQSRKRIIQSALKLFSEKGFFETRIPEISAHAKVGVGSLYRHFKNKEDMFNETFRTCIQDFEKFLDEGLLKETSHRERFFTFWKGLRFFSQREFDQFTMIERNLSSSLLDEESLMEADKLRTKINNYFSYSTEKDDLYFIYPCIILGSFSGILRLYVGERSLNDSVLEKSAEMLWDGFSKISAPNPTQRKKDKQPKRH
ncbi:TetR/AcrR family transcriptional regulator [Leptospira wolffii]|nr:TetR/AcrR family transcriptional regulator [Leptospira wolffii]EPG65415.1 transcriptional regulator, TetR family [Leptospira wolffii serovar Khorat str. Khorat-H2]